MPKVGTKHFSYTKRGRKAATKARKRLKGGSKHGTHYGGQKVEFV